MELIKTVLEKLGKSNLYVSIKKSGFHVKEAEYRQGCPCQRARSVENGGSLIRPPQFYRRFIEKISMVAKPPM